MQKYSRNERGQYWVAVGCVVAFNLIDSLTDLLTFSIGQSLHPFQIAFLRNLIGACVMIPWMLRRGTLYFRLKRPLWHVLRALVGVVAVGGFTISVIKVPLMKCTAIGFLEPVFFLPLAAFILHERVDWVRICGACVGLCGIVLITLDEFQTYQFWSLLAVLSTVGYAALTCVERLMVEHEHPLSLIFSFELGCAIFLLFPAWKVWQPVTTLQWEMLALLGLGSVFLQVFLFKMFQYAEISAVFPLRYTEILLTAFFAYLFFGQKPNLSAWMGASIIVITTWFLASKESRKNRVQPHYLDGEVQAH